ncbi:MAG: LytTR family DNA-binding domain-containing protein [Pseudomonadota bacterium]
MGDGPANSRESWRPVYWGLAAVPGASLFLLDTIQRLAYETSRAPNVGVGAQIALMAVFFGLFTLVPRVIWGIALRYRDSRTGGMITALALAGLVLSALHLLLLSLILRVMYSPAGWGVSHLLHSFGEVWLRDGGVWLLVYAAGCGLVGMRLRTAARERKCRESLTVRSGQREVVLPLHDLVWIEACGNYVTLHSTRGTFMLRKTLAALEHEIGHAGFHRSHRRALVNVAHVEAIRRRPDRSYGVELSGSAQAPLSRRKAGALRDLLANRTAPGTVRH